MNNIFRSINDLDYIDEDYDLVVVENEEDKNEPLFQEIKLYDPCKTREENFKDGITEKYFLFGVSCNGNISINTQLPDSFSKVVVDLNIIEEHSVPEFAVVDYDCLFGVRMTSFIKYKSNFFTCDERVFFEALLIKYKAFGHVPFFWSKEVIWKEIGVKKDRATKISKRFSELGILNVEVKKSVVNGRPQQITYYEPIANRIIELVPEIFGERDDDDGFINELKRYVDYKPSPLYNQLQ